MKTATSSLFTFLSSKCKFIPVGKGIRFYPNFPIDQIVKYLLNNRFENPSNLAQDFGIENNKVLASEVKRDGVERRVEAFIHKGQVVLYDGHRRLWAARLAGFKTIPLAVHEHMSLQEASALAVFKNTVDADRSRRFLKDTEEALAIANMVKSHGGGLSKALRSYLARKYPTASSAELKRQFHSHLPLFSRNYYLGRSKYALELLRGQYVYAASAMMLACVELSNPKAAQKLVPLVKAFCGGKDGKARKTRRLSVGKMKLIVQAIKARRPYLRVFKGTPSTRITSKVRVSVSRKGADGRELGGRIAYGGITYTAGDSKKAIIGSAANICHKRVMEEKAAYKLFVKEVQRANF